MAGEFVRGNWHTYDSATNNKTIIISNGTSIIDCDDGEPQASLSAADTCHVVCNTLNARIADIHCRGAGTCLIDASQPNCTVAGNIYANQGSSTLIVTAQASTSSGGTIHCPSNGAMTTCSITGQTDTASFHRLAIQAHSTNTVSVQCAAACTGLMVNATNAQYLNVTVDATGSLDIDGDRRSQIHCPVLRQQSSVPCIIDTTAATRVANLDVFAAFGTPQNLMYHGGRNDEQASLLLHCNAGNSTFTRTTSQGGTYTFDSGACYITASPTSSPSKMPTESPTAATMAPTTTAPTTAQPSNSPSLHPTSTPSASPSMYPTVEPTDVTATPSMFPSEFTSFSPTGTPIFSTTPDVEDQDQDQDQAFFASAAVLGSTANIIIIAVCFSFCCLLCCAVYAAYRYKTVQAEKDSAVIRMHSGTQPSVTNVTPYSTASPPRGKHEKTDSFLTPKHMERDDSGIEMGANSGDDAKSAAFSTPAKTYLSLQENERVSRKKQTNGSSLRILTPDGYNEDSSDEEVANDGDSNRVPTNVLVTDTATSKPAPTAMRQANVTTYQAPPARQQADFGQMLSANVEEQDMVMDDIVQRMNTSSLNMHKTSGV